MLDDRFNADGSLNLEKLSKAFADQYQERDAMIEMTKLLQKLLEENSKIQTSK